MYSPRPAFHAWAIERLGVAVPKKIDCYREAGSFVAFLIARFGLDRVLQFFRASTRDDSLTVIEQRFQQAFGTTLAGAEAEWLAFVG